VTNWDLSDRLTRLQVAVGVTYGSDTARVEEILLRCVRECPYALEDPPPRAIFSEFGDNALLFRLYVFLASRDKILDARHALHTAIERAFREAGVGFAFPQRDVRLEVRDPLRVRLETP
jgi:potassium efflux system protein